MVKTKELARCLGQLASIKNYPFRVSPFYEEKDEKGIDITKELDKEFFSGYDEEQLEKAKKKEKDE